MPYDLRVTSIEPAATKARRADIQGLRAFAVGLVVVFHFFPSTIPGGFIGVDVFFVISGFLITSLLIREVQQTGTVSLSRFYVRRVRRLMPAALTTTVATMLAAVVIVGPVQLVSILKDAAWTSAYLANVHFGMNPAGYFVTSEPSPFLHFWSLAVEEQYYIVWPLLLLAVIAVARGRALSVMPYVIAVIIVTSLVLSVVLTASGSSHAYYSLGTRAWELGLGGAVAFLVERGARAPGRRTATAASLIGCVVVLVTAFAFTELTPFPSWRAAIPTVATALIIWAGSYHRSPLDPLWQARPVQLIGNASYSIYLWHWPVVVLGVIVIGDDRESRALLAVLALTLGLLAYLIVEKRIGRVGLTWTSARTLALAGALTVAAVAAPATAALRIGTTGGGPIEAVDVDTPLAAVEDGRIILSPAPDLRVPEAVPANVTPTLDSLTADLAEVFRNGCYADTLQVCEGGDPDGETTIVLAGDSHVGQWWPAVNAAAASSGWKLYIVGMNGCALADVPVSKSDTAEAWPECSAWQADATAAIVDLKPNLILYANHAQGYSAKVSLRDDFANLWTAGVDRTLSTLTEAAPVLMFGQSPAPGFPPATCLSEHLDDVAACSVPLDQAVRPHVRAAVEALAARERVIYFDPSSLLCTDVCDLMDQNVIKFVDASHLSKTYVLGLTDTIQSIIEAALAVPKA